jgi:uncharacterized tellurite resistance protein B-like protein
VLDRLKALFRTTTETEEVLEPALAAAALMFEVVWADHDIGNDEIQSMTRLLQQIFAIEKQRVDELVTLTRANHNTSVGVFPFTRALNEQLNEDEKYQVLKAMWSIALADEQLDSFEEHTIRRIADLLYVPHQRFIAAKLAAKAERNDTL